MTSHEYFIRTQVPCTHSGMGYDDNVLRCNLNNESNYPALELGRKRGGGRIFEGGILAVLLCIVFLPDLNQAGGHNLT